jgi:O-antigen ligase/tetratricopeptide (TPR) repeat protein
MPETMRSRYLAKPQLTTASAPWWQRLPWGWVLAFLACNAVTLSVGTYYAQLHWAAYAGWVGFGALALAAGGGWLVFTEGELTGFGRGVDLWLLAAFAGMALISSQAPDAMRSWLSVTQCLLYVWIAYGSLQAFAKQPWRAATFLGAGLIAMLLACFTIHGTFGSFWGIIVEPMAYNLVWPVGHWNFLGSFLCLTWPVAAILARQAGPGLARWGWISVTAVAMLSVARSGSRSSLVAMLIQVALWAIVERQTVWNAVRHTPKWLKLATGAALLAAAVTAMDRVSIIAGRLGLLGNAIGQVLRGEPLTDVSAAQRLEMWVGGWHGFLARPWWGHGLGSVPTQFLPFQIQDPRFGDIAIPQLHNTFVHAAFEGGLILLAILGAGVALVGWACRRAARHEDPALGRLAIALMIGLSGYLVCLQADFHWQVPALSLSAVLVVTLLLALAGTRRLVHPGWRIGAGFLALPLFFIAVRLWLPAVQAHYLYDAGRYTLGANQAEETIALWDQAFQHAPDTLFYRLARGSILHTQGLQPTGVRADLLTRAQADFHELNEHAALQTSLLKEGAIAIQLGKPKDAFPPLERAAKLVPYSGAAHFLLGMAHFTAGRQADAIPHLGRALSCAPVLMTSSFLTEPPGKVTRPEALRYAERIVRRWLQHRPHDAELHYRLGRLLLAEQRYKEARQTLDLAERERPTSTTDRSMSRLDVRIQHAVSTVDLEEGHYQAILDRYRPMMESGGPDVPAALLQVWAHKALGHASEAAAMAERVAQPAQALMPGATAALLLDRRETQRSGVPISLDRRDVWIIQSFRKLAPLIFFTSLNFTGDALFLSDEVFPWGDLPVNDPFAI